MSEYTRDAFHRGVFWLTQPDSGHRAGMDAMMLAAVVPSNFAGRLADFGAGAGAAGLAVVARCSKAQVVLVENAPEMLDAASRTLADPDNKEVATRAELLAANVALAGAARVDAGLADNSFDFVIMNPPFNARADRESSDPLRRTAHVMTDGLFEAWIRSAAAVLKQRGGLAIIARPESLRELLETMEKRFGNAEILPIHPRPDKPAIRIVVRAIRGSRAALKLMPPLHLHEAGSNRFSERSEEIVNGRVSLFGD